VNLSDIVLFSWKNIKSRRLRSYLTMLGIIIGIVAIISLIMLGEGLERGMTENFDKLGARRLFIGPKNMNPGGPPTGVSRLSNSDVDVVRKLTMVEYTTKVYFDTVNIKYQRKSEVARVGAFDTQNVKKFFDDVDIELEEGKWFETDKNVVVVGWGIAHKLFDKELRLRNAITLDGKKFRVVGIKERQGDRNSDYQIHIPLKAMQELKGKPEAFTSFSAMIKLKKLLQND
jgi:putative ABC transport system permease protein